MRIRKSERGRMLVKQMGRALAVLAGAVILVWCDPIVSRAETTGTVLPKSVNIRKQPEQGSEPISSSSVGKEITILGKVETSGTTWYQVYVDSNTVGYVRADMVEVGEGDIPTVSAEVSTSDTTTDADTSQADSVDVPSIGSGTGAQVDAQEEMAFQYATTKVQAKVRPDPSTSNNHIDSLTSGTQVVVSGKSEGSDGKTWYFVNFTGTNGSEKTGYIRSDLLELGDLLPVEDNPEPEPDAEAAASEAAPRNDYELKIETDSDGEEVWYLYDNIKGNKEPLLRLLESTGSQSVEDKEDTKAIVKQRIVIVVLAVLLAALAVTVIIMAFKLRDAYYEDYEDDEAEEEEQTSGRGAAAKERAERRRTSGGEEERTSRRRESAETPRRERRESAETSRRERPERTKREREVTYREEPETEGVKPAAKRKTKNFLLDDDEFEFEFLNMEDKDMK